MEVLEISLFLGLLHTDPSRAWIVYESEFEVQRGMLARIYAKERENMPGGFSVKWYGQECLGPAYWDEVIYLATFFDQALACLNSEGQADFSFPDQPVTVHLDMKGYHKQMRLLLDGKTVLICNPDEFRIKMSRASERLRNFLAAL